MAIDVRATENGDIDINTIGDLSTVQGENNVHQQLATVVARHTTLLAGQPLRPVDRERFNGAVREDLADHSYTDAIVSITTTNIDEESIDVRIRTTSEEIGLSVRR